MDVPTMSFQTPLQTAAARGHLVSLLLASADEDETAFAELYRLTSAKLFGVVARICGDSGLTEDVLVDVYLTIWRRAGAYEPGRASPITWMATIARNRAIDFVRRLPKTPHVALTEAVEVADKAPLVEEQLIMAEEGRRLHLCLDQLENPQAQAIRTAFFDGLSYSDLAAKMAVPLGTMKSWVRRGLLRLKECLHAGD
jgi:RNA polymerase sigma factor (sigma-70 family)